MKHDVLLINLQDNVGVALVDIPRAERPAFPAESGWRR